MNIVEMVWIWEPVNIARNETLFETGKPILGSVLKAEKIREQSVKFIRRQEFFLNNSG